MNSDKWPKRIAPIVALILLGQINVLQAGSIPFQDTWNYDGPQPHGPGVPLVSHLPHNFGGPASDSMGYEAPGGPIVYQYVADDFALPFDATLGRIVYYGFYDSQILPVGDETFQINIHEPRAGDGLPGDVLFSQTVVNPFREWTGRNVISFGGGREYRFVVDLTLPLFLPGSETLWLSIYQVGDPTSSFRWEDSTTSPMTGHAFNNEVFPNWMTTVPSSLGNTAFQMYAVPESCSLSLLFLGALTASRFRGRRSVL